MDLTTNTTPEEIRSDLDDAGYGYLTVERHRENTILIKDENGDFWDAEADAERHRKHIEGKIDLKGDEMTVAVAMTVPDGYVTHSEAVRAEGYLWVIGVTPPLFQ